MYEGKRSRNENRQPQSRPREDDLRRFDTRGENYPQERWDRDHGSLYHNYNQERDLAADMEQHRRGYTPDNERMLSDLPSGYRARPGGMPGLGDYFDDRTERQDYRGRGPKSYQRSDQRIIEDICEHLSDAPDIDASEITVVCSQGLVTLEGSVDSRATKHRVEDLVDACRGVKDIQNRLIVSPH